MTRPIDNDDPYELSLLQYHRDLWHILQTDLPEREAVLPDGRILAVWTTRAQLMPDLYPYIEDRVKIDRTSPDFPGPGQLCAPAFHARVAWPNLDGHGVWQFAASPEELATHLQREEGAIMPASMRHDLHADATLGHYGDLHVDDIGPVFQMEAVRRDIAALRLADNPDTVMTAGSHLAVLDQHKTSLIAELNTRRENNRHLYCSTDHLIGGQSDEWTLDARIRELRTWPGGEHTARTITAYDKADADLRHGPVSESMNNFDTAWTLKENFSNTMSHARIQDWSDTPRLPGRPSTPAAAMTLTETDRAHQKPNPVDRGIRREPKQPAPRATDNAEHQRHQIRMETAHQLLHRRPSM